MIFKRDTMMKEKYQRPILKFEEYELNASIASNCANVISFGPGDNYGNQVCDEFGGDFDVQTYTAQRTGKSAFYEDGGICDCLYSSGGNGYFTS